MKTAAIYATVTEQIIQLLEKHQMNWDKPWICLAADGLPARNAQSQKVYSGINQFLLSLICEDRGYEKNTWLTFRQAKLLGATVIKGSKSTPIYFYKSLYFDKDNKEVSYEQLKKMSEQERNSREIHRVPFLKRYYLFNVFQIQGLGDAFYEVGEKPSLLPFEKDEQAERLLFSTEAKIEIKESGNAYYNPIRDVIRLPLREQFKGTEPFYATALHELGHWTGHSSRLNRKLVGRFGSTDYAKEELVAELTSAFLCASLGFTKTITNNAAYIQNWLGVLKTDTKLVFIASSYAQKAAEYILEYSSSEPFVENELVAK